jgi:hypothetical protein
VHLVLLAVELGAGLEAVGDVGVAGGGQQRDKPLLFLFFFFWRTVR